VTATARGWHVQLNHIHHLQHTNTALLFQHNIPAERWHLAARNLCHYCSTCSHIHHLQHTNTAATRCKKAAPHCGTYNHIAQWAVNEGLLQITSPTHLSSHLQQPDAVFGISQESCPSHPPRPEQLGIVQWTANKGLSPLQDANHQPHPPQQAPPAAGCCLFNAGKNDTALHPTGLSSQTLCSGQYSLVIKGRLQTTRPTHLSRRLQQPDAVLGAAKKLPLSIPTGLSSQTSRSGQ
jgi:hypothetical protein